MAVAWLTVDVRVWHPNGKRVPDNVFLNKLKAMDGAVVKTHRSRELWQTARVTLVLVQAKDFATEREPSEAFEEATRKQLLRAAEWLGGQPIELFADLRRDGYKMDLFIESWIVQDQFDLELPPEFVAACSHLGLGVKVLTND